MSGALVIELEDETLQALDQLAERTNRSLDDLVIEAVRDFLALQAWQRQKVEAGISAAERLEFVSDDELGGIIEKYSTVE